MFIMIRTVILSVLVVLLNNFRESSGTVDISLKNNTFETYETKLSIFMRLYKKNMIRVLKNGTILEEFICASSNSAEDFPEDLFTYEQLKAGAITLHFLAGVYFFTILAVLCNDYFIPSVECICKDLHIAPNVAAATFMSVATSCPELFVNVISTFFTESDMGLGTIVGSALFNTLGVGALGGLAASKAIPIERWPLVRDCVIYSITIAMLVAISWDGVIFWYEAIALLIMYIFYFILMFQNDRIQRSVKNLRKKLCRHSEIDICIDLDKNNNNNIMLKTGFKNEGFISTDFKRKSFRSTTSLYVIPYESSENKHLNNEKNISDLEKDLKISTNDTITTRKSLWKNPGNGIKKLWWLYTWPIKIVLTITVPNPVTWRKLYPITFIMCIVWIGVNAYLVFWMVAVIGITLGVPDAVMGMTFLAAGGCLPEAISIVIMSRKGEGGMGVSNSLGANTLAVLMSLGLPWFIKTIQHGFKNEAQIYIDSTGVIYTIIGLLLATWSLFTVISFSGYTLSRRTGVFLMTTYLIFVILAILSEIGIFFDQC